MKSMSSGGVLKRSSLVPTYALAGLLCGAGLALLIGDEQVYQAFSGLAKVEVKWLGQADGVALGIDGRPRQDVDRYVGRVARAQAAMDAAACIGCGACVAACPNASAMLFTAAKASHLGLLPQGQPERHLRVRRMVAAMDEAGFGGCTNHGECEAACPKGISLGFIARLNRDYLKATLIGAEESKADGGA